MPFHVLGGVGELLVPPKGLRVVLNCLLDELMYRFLIAREE